MAFPTGWRSKHKITIDNTKVSGSANLTDFPVYLSGDNFLPDVFTKAAARREINANWLLNDASLQGYWRLESDGSDSGPNGYNLTNSGASFVTGKFGNGADFEEGDSDLMYINNPANLNFSGSFTISAWINVESASLTGAVLSKWQGNSQYIFGTSAGKPYIIVKNSSNVNYDITGNTTLSLSTWYHIVGVWDTTNNKLKIYLNGLPDNVDTTTSGTPMSDTSYVVMGAQETTGTFRKFDGIIDDVAVFNRALSDYEVKALYYGTADLRFSSDISGSTELASEVVFFDPDNSLAEVHVKVPTVSYNTDTDFYVWYEASSEAPYAPNATYGSQAVWSDYQGVWHFEEYPSVTAPQIKDSTANGNNGTSSGSMTSSDLVSGKIGKALDFDGTDDYIDCGSGASLQLDGNSFTVSMWIKLGQINRFNYPLAKGGNTASNQWLHIGIRQNNNWTVAFYSNDLNVAGSPSVETWYHLVATYDTTTNSRKLYLNGSLIGSDTSTSDLTNTNSYSLRIGNYYSNYFLGSVDEVYILNTVRSADWIATEYANQNSPSTFATASEARDSSEILSEIHGVQDIYSEIKSEITGIRDSSEILSETHGIEDIANEIQSQISGAEYKIIKGGYRILIKDRDDNFLGEIDNFRRLEFGKRHNNYGTCQFEMPVNDDKADLIELRKNKIEIYWQENGDMTRVWAGELANRTGKLDNAGNNWDVISGFTWLEQLNSRFTRSVQLYRDEDQGDILWDLIYSTQFPYLAFNKFYPTGNGTDSENMPVVGVSSAYLAVNTLNDDTYIANEEDGNYISLFTTDFSFIPVGATINSVKVYARIETLTVDYGDNEIAILVDSQYHGSGDLGISNNQPFTTYSHTWTQNPETSLDWTVSDLVGFEFGVNLSFARCSLIYVEVDFETTDSDKFDLGFTKGSIEATTNRDRTYNNQNIMEAFINMSNVISGCDFEITDDKVLNVYLLKGEDKTQDIILEYGKNVSDVQIDENFVHPVNKAIVLGQSTEVTDSLLRVERNDTNLQDEYKVREGLMSEMDVSETSTLQEKGDALIRKQGEPLIKLDLTMVKGSEINPTMFDLGDLVRVVIKDGHYNIDEEFRIYEWNVEFDDNDAPQLSLVLGKFIADIS